MSAQNPTGKVLPGPSAAKQGAPAQPAAPPPAPGAETGLGAQMNDWIRTEGPWWLSSFVFHLLLGCLLLLIPHGKDDDDSAKARPELQAVTAEPPVDEKQAEKKIEEAKIEPAKMPEDTPLKENLVEGAPPAGAIGPEMSYDDSTEFEAAGGGRNVAATAQDLGGFGGFDVIKPGPGAAIVGGRGGIGTGIGTGTGPGSGGSGEGFGGRGKGRRAWVSGYGGTPKTELAVRRALDWLARHQLPDGGWSLDHRKRCKDPSCKGHGDHKADSGATALGVLPFLAMGITHVGSSDKKDSLQNKYRNNVYQALYWLTNHQKPNGDLAAGAGQPMYSHGLCAIALCEAAGLSGDKTIGRHAIMAIRFIESAQNKNDGGWRYNPGDAGDTSVVGWQVMALKSAQMAGIQVNPASLEGARRFLKSCSRGYGGSFSYQPGGGTTPPMSAVGLLCSQYMGAKPGDAGLEEGAKLLMSHSPDKGRKNLYYWYYATQVMHNMPGATWDQWNRKMRNVLVDSQETDDKKCSFGSWSSEGDPWGNAGGRHMVTSLAALTLEVYYRYLPLFKLDKESELPPPQPLEDPGKPEEAPKPDAKK